MNLGVRHELQDAGSNLHPEVEEDAGRQELLLLGVTSGSDVLQVDCPQLGEDERVEQRAHVHHTRLALLSEPRQYHLYVVSDVTGGLQWYGLTWWRPVLG